MSFNTLESSTEDGQPILLFRFTSGSIVWRYTSRAQPYIDPDGNTWQSVAISDTSGVRQSGEAAADALTIECPITLGPVQAHQQPGAPDIHVAMLRTHEGDSELKVTYSGEIAQVNFVGVGMALVTCETTSVTMKRPGLRLPWQKNCPYALYDPHTCKVDKDDYGTNERVQTISGFTITITGTPPADGYLNGGYMTWLSPRGVEYRGIESNVGATLLVFGLTGDMYPGLLMTLYPGCAMDKATCTDKFDNLLNYGGVPNLPGKSPFDGKPVFN